MKELPDKLWQLLELAINDAQLCQSDSQFKLDMLEWLEPDCEDTVCRVCMAGAVMAKTLGCPTDEECYPSRIGGTTEAKLRAINELRLGDVYGAKSWIDRHRGSSELEAKLEQHMYLLDAVREAQMTPWINGWKAHKDLAALLKQMDI